MINKCSGEQWKREGSRVASQAGDGAQLAESVPSMPQALGLILSSIQTCNPNPWGSGVKNLLLSLSTWQSVSERSPGKAGMGRMEVPHEWSFFPCGLCNRHLPHFSLPGGEFTIEKTVRDQLVEFSRLLICQLPFLSPLGTMA